MTTRIRCRSPGLPEPGSKQAEVEHRVQREDRRHETGLVDFGDPRFLGPLGTLTEARP